MNRTVILGIVSCSLLITGTAIPLTTTAEVNQAGNTDWADECKDARPVPDGKYNGSIAPNEQDVFAVNLSDGGFIELNVSFTGGSDEFVVFTETHEDEFSDGSVTASGGVPILDAFDSDTASSTHDGARTVLRKTSRTYQLRLYSEGPGPLCVQLNTNDHGAADWRLSFTSTRPSPPPINCSL